MSPEPIQIPTVGRLAPSPTGLLHLGHARTFLIAWWCARSTGAGRVILRVDDLDGERCRREFVDAALRDLEWLGIDWDGPVRFQSGSLPALSSAVARLLREGKAYACTCTRADIQQAQTAPQRGTVEARYPGTCRDRYASLQQAAEQSGRAPGVRLRVDLGPITFIDELFGEQCFDVHAEVGDFLIARRDGAPAYQLACVVDDSEQGVTEVVRGADLLASTARQKLLQGALGLPHPRWLHVPLVTNEHGERLAKRARALGLAELREAGVDPRAIVAWAARGAGMAIPERVTASAVLPAFERSRLSRAEVPVTPEELRGWR